MKEVLTQKKEDFSMCILAFSFIILKKPKIEYIMYVRQKNDKPILLNFKKFVV